MKVLVAVDSSKKSFVIETAMNRPWPTGTEFSVVSVVDMRHWEGMPALVEDAEHEAKSIVNAASELLSKTGHVVTRRRRKVLRRKSLRITRSSGMPI